MTRTLTTTSLSLMGLSPPRLGTIVSNQDGTITYSPLKSWSGTDIFAYSIIDSNGGVASASVAVVVQPAKTENHFPDAQDQSVSVNENSPVKIKLGAMDPDDDRLRFVLVSKPSHGRILQFSSSTGTLAYIPDQNYNRKDSFEFKVHDGTDFSKKAEVFIKIVKNDQSDKDQVGERPNKQELSNDDMSNDDTLPNDSTSSQQSPP